MEQLDKLSGFGKLRTKLNGEIYGEIYGEIRDNALGLSQAKQKIGMLETTKIPLP